MQTCRYSIVMLWSYFLFLWLLLLLNAEAFSFARNPLKGYGSLVYQLYASTLDRSTSSVKLDDKGSKNESGDEIRPDVYSPAISRYSGGNYEQSRQSMGGSYIFPIVENGEDLTANTGMGLESVLQGVYNEVGVQMKYDLHAGEVKRVNYALKFFHTHES